MKLSVYWELCESESVLVQSMWDCVILSDSFSYGDIHIGVFIPNNMSSQILYDHNDIIKFINKHQTVLKDNIVNRDISVDLVWVLVQYLSFFQNLNQVLVS